MDTYKMEYVCRNCGTAFQKDIPKGDGSQGKGGECPYCGTQDYPMRSFSRYRPDMNPYKD